MNRTPARPRARDWVLGALVAAAHLVRVRSGQTGGSPYGPWTGIGAALGVLAGLALVWRRLHLPHVVVVVLACSAGMAIVDGVVAPWAAWVLIWHVAMTGTDPRAGAKRSGSLAVATVVVLVLGALVQGEPGALALLIGLTVVLALVAVLVRSERGRLEALRRRAAVEERLRIARDLHDLVGHGLSVVSVQSGTARLALDAGEPEAARRALAAIESSSRTALRELRQMLGVLRDAEPTLAGQPVGDPGLPGMPAPGVRDIERLVENVRAGGVDVTLDVTGDWESQAAGVQMCAYRVVQEGLTNAVRHAPGVPVTVHLDARGTVGVIRVRTLPAAAAAAVAPARDTGGSGQGSGQGLTGLSTRVTALGGEFLSGPSADGWLIEARLPFELTGGNR